jgi:DNA-binding transcriptional regulator YdaS (Cro superfamily)
MTLDEYLSSERGRQATLAKAIGAHAPDLSRWAKGTRKIPVEHAALIEQATGGLVTRKEMFPNDWDKIWPELAAPKSRRATDPTPEPGHAGRQPPSPHNMLDTVPDRAAVIPVAKDGHLPE